MWAKKSAKAKEKVKSSFVRAAQRLGLLSEDQALEVDELLDDDVEHSSQDIVVGAGILSLDDARRVEQERKTEDIEGHLEDKFKRASLALADQKTSAEKLCDATQPMSTADILAAKKKAGVA